MLSTFLPVLGENFPISGCTWHARHSIFFLTYFLWMSCIDVRYNHWLRNSFHKDYPNPVNVVAMNWNRFTVRIRYLPNDVSDIRDASAPRMIRRLSWIWLGMTRNQNIRLRVCRIRCVNIESYEHDGACLWSLQIRPCYGDLWSPVHRMSSTVTTITGFSLPDKVQSYLTPHWTLTIHEEVSMLEV